MFKSDPKSDPQGGTDELHGLEALGYKVERVPYLGVAPAQREPDKPEVPQPAYPALTYNNVLLANVLPEAVFTCPSAALCVAPQR